MNNFLKNVIISSRHLALAIKSIAIAIAFIISFAEPARSINAESYASTSRLASGNWAKIEVVESGMQFISNATLKRLGFPDPDKVNVYGFGGRMLPEALFESMPDDLPLIPSVKTPSGILFFGLDCISWENNTGSTTYTHTNNPYSDHSYYFISDADTSRHIPDERETLSVNNGDAIRTFTERIAHEQDLIAPTNSGRTLLGEDFRTQKKRDFTFNLPGNTGAATVTICFGTHTTNGSSSLLISANGERLPSSSKDVIPAVTSENTLFQTTTTIKEVADPGERLNLTIEYSSSGALFTAALDYIEIEYERALKMEGNELYFYLNPAYASTAVIEGCGESTLIWDVTDPLNPLNVEYTLSGNAASITVPSGYREYIAFNASGISRQATASGKVANQDIHGMEIPEMVIITPEAFKTAAQKLADIHAATDGLKVTVVTDTQVYNEFSSGVADVTAFRKMLKMWYDRALASGTDYTRYCLLFGRPSYDNKMVTPTVKNSGYPRLPIWQSTSNSKGSSYSTDDYVGMLADNTSPLNMSSANIHTAVGRMPVKSVAEANTAVAKLQKYMLNPKLGAWRNNVMIIADDQDNGQHLDQAEDVYAAMTANGNGANFVYEKLYLDAYKLSYGATGAVYPEAKQRMFDRINEGVGYIDYIGHANPKSWGHESLLTWTDINSMGNNNLPFIYAATCEFLRWDDDEVSGAEIMWLNPEAGVIGMICPSREVLIRANGTLNEQTAKYVYMRNADGSAMRTGDIMINGKNDVMGDSNKLRYGLIGDPAMKILSPDYLVGITSIDGIDPTSSDEMPVIPARASFDVSGFVSDMQGNRIDDFNGFVEIQLYDAESVVTTNGNGTDGVVSTYNDRRSRIFTGRVKVSNGFWTASVIMPPEIDNNYSPALLSLYAYDDSGREANGSFDKFYVYGYDSTAPEDYEGPSISEFYLNSPSFNSGDLVSPSPILFAKFSDPSGINVSDAGIGHSMTLSIDDKIFFNDLNLFYNPDADDFLSGSITYPLQGIEPGEHTLKFTVWDNANNSTSKELAFSVSASWLPEITKLTTDVNPATSGVNFLVATDGANGDMDCSIEVYDLMGRRVWTGESSSISATGTSTTFGWDLCDENGNRVGRGIYIYRAIVTTAEGATIVKSNKLAVTAQ